MRCIYYQKRQLYVGIDVHVKEHKVAIVPCVLFERPGTIWKKIKTLTLRNARVDFDFLDDLIRSLINDPKDVVIAVDHTGGHYSEPIVYYLLNRGYEVFYLETKGVRAARERLLDQENKSDAIDSVSSAYMLYLRDTQGLSFRISLIKYELGSKAAVMNSLILQRLHFNKLITQITNKLHQLLIATFPEGEAQYFKKLLKIIPSYSTTQDICNSNGLKGIKRINANDKESIVKLAANTVGVPDNINMGG